MVMVDERSLYVAASDSTDARDWPGTRASTSKTAAAYQPESLWSSKPQLRPTAPA